MLKRIGKDPILQDCIEEELTVQAPAGTITSIECASFYCSLQLDDTTFECILLDKVMKDPT